MKITATGSNESEAQSNLAIKMDKMDESSERDIQWGKSELYIKGSLYRYTQQYSLA